MHLRTALSLANLAAILVAFLVLYELPQYSNYAFYALLGWIFVGFGLLYLPRRSGRVAAGSGTDLSGTFAGSPGAPLPSGASGSARSTIDFCVYCGTTLPSGAPACPACGHRVAPV